MPKKTEKENSEEFDFEKSLKRLEKIVEELEEGSPSLKKALTLFQEGKKLSQMCFKELSRFEQKVLKIIDQEKGDISLEEFSSPISENYTGEDEEDL